MLLESNSAAYLVELPLLAKYTVILAFEEILKLTFKLVYDPPPPSLKHLLICRLAKTKSQLPVAQVFPLKGFIVKFPKEEELVISPSGILLNIIYVVSMLGSDGLLSSPSCVGSSGIVGVSGVGCSGATSLMKSPFNTPDNFKQCSLTALAFNKFSTLLTLLTES